MANKNLFFFLKLIKFVAVVSVAIPAFAQLDPTSTLLLRSSGTKPTLDSSRYEVKPGNTGRDKQSTTLPPKMITSPAPAPTPAPARAPAPAPVTETASAAKKNEAKAETQAEAKKSEAPRTPEEEQALAEQVRDMILGGDYESIAEYRERIHPQDPRHNLLQLSLVPGLMYVDSESESWYRNYHTSSPTLGLDAKIWLTPFTGVHAGYLTSLGADLTAAPDTTEKTKADIRFFNAGLLFRTFSSHSRRSPSFQFGIVYDENQLIVPKSEEDRIRLKSKGWGFSIEARMPSSNNHAWKVGAQFLPKMDTDEQKTQVTYSSGKLDSQQSFQFALTSEYVIDRKRQVFWSLSHKFNKSVYEGASTGNDPITGSTFEGLNVKENATLFQLGVTWGD